MASKCQNLKKDGTMRQPPPGFSYKGLFFTPLSGEITGYYSISDGMERTRAFVRKYQYSHLAEGMKFARMTPIEGRGVNLSGAFSINDELKKIFSMEVSGFVTVVLGIISLRTGLDFLFAKRNFKIGGGAIGMAVILFVANRYFAHQARLAIFDAGNKIISAFENSSTLLFDRSQYDLRFRFFHEAPPPIVSGQSEDRPPPNC